MPSFIEKCGEQVSFAVLGRVGEFINTVVRANDVVARYSEYSFVILFPETEPEGAWIAIHKLEEAVSGQTVQTSEEELSIGFEPFVTGRITAIRPSYQQTTLCSRLWIRPTQHSV